MFNAVLRKQNNAVVSVLYFLLSGLNVLLLIRPVVGYKRTKVSKFLSFFLSEKKVSKFLSFFLQKRYVHYLETIMKKMGGQMPPAKELIVKSLEIKGLDGNTLFIVC